MQVLLRSVEDSLKSIRDVYPECDEEGSDHVTTKNIKVWGHYNIPGSVSWVADSKSTFVPPL